MIGTFSLLALAAALASGSANGAQHQHQHQHNQQQQPAGRAKANLASLVEDADYPASALAAREEGTVEFMLDVDSTGRVSACTLVRSSGSAALDSTTCRLMSTRGRFTPARDSQGNPVPDRIAGRISWKLPPAPPPAP